MLPGGKRKVVALDGPALLAFPELRQLLHNEFILFGLQVPALQIHADVPEDSRRIADTHISGHHGSFFQILLAVPQANIFRFRRQLRDAVLIIAILKQRIVRADVHFLQVRPVVFFAWSGNIKPGNYESHDSKNCQKDKRDQASTFPAFFAAALLPVRERSRHRGSRRRGAGRLGAKRLRAGHRGTGYRGAGRRGNI